MPLDKLEIPPNRASYGVDDPAYALSAKLDGGASRTRLDMIGGDSVVSVQWTLNRTTFEQLVTFYNDTTVYASQPFLLDLYLDSPTLTEHECNFIPGSFKLQSQIGHRFVVGATLEVKPFDVDDTTNQEIIDDYVPDFDWEDNPGGFVQFILNENGEFNGTGTDIWINAGDLYIPLGDDETWDEHFENNGKTSVQDFVDDPNYDLWFEPDGSNSGQYVAPSQDVGQLLEKGVVIMSIDWTAITGNAGDITFTPTIEYSADNVIWTPFGSGAFSGGFVNGRYFRYTLGVTSASELSNAKINEVQLKVIGV